MTARQYGRLRLAVVAVGLLCLVVGCSDPAGPDACRRAAGIAVGGGNCLVFEDGGRLSGQHARIEQVVRETLGAVRRLLPITGVAIRVGPGPAFLIPEIGVGGALGRALGRLRSRRSVPPLPSDRARVATHS